ncbi:uncharacterized protein [Aegilops tauschii subsp. strangulata]|uniref:uncharacterized protein n=1 Tax=Aegilops tauschii subsp. strangulata TaxID=200361 RepID=UPI00098A366F|nr:ethylene-responsive transcription factor ERF084-like [Aegilops tauschii subsp. strangulata]
MPPRRRGSSGYRGIRERSNGRYSAEIRSGDVRLSLGSFRTAHEAARAYDAAARSASPLRLVSLDQDRADHVRLQRRLLVAEEDKRAMAESRRRHPEDVAAENAFWAERTARRRAERADSRRRKALALSQCDIVEAGGQSIFSPNDLRWDDMWLDTSDNTIEDDDGDDDDGWESP